MTASWGPLSPAPRPNEESLLRRAREGDGAAFEELYAAHQASARRLATILAGIDGADELVAESVARVLAQLRAGKGPTANFRAYLHTTIRNRHRDLLRATQEHPSSDQPWLLDDQEPAAEDLAAGIDDDVALSALASLPDRWQRLLWHLEVEERAPAEVAATLGISPAAVSSMAYRAREALRRAYLDLHAGPPPARDRCRWVRERLSQYVRNDLGARATAKMADHIDGCVSCAAAYAELDRVNKKLAALIFPVVLVGGMAGLETAAITGATSGLAGSGGVSGLAQELTARAAGGSSTPAAAGGTAASGSGSVFASLTTVPGHVVAASVAGVIALVGVAAAATWAIAGSDDPPRTHVADSPSVSSSSQAPSSVAPTAPPTPSDDPTRPTQTPKTDPVVVGVPTEAETSPETTTETDPTTPPTTGPSTTEPRPTEPRPTDSSPTEPSPNVQPIVVRPVAPTAVPIDGRCGRYGRLALPRTEGVRYELIEGDGREGRWVVRAVAKDGFVIPDGAQRRWSGHLGQYYPCPAIDQVTAVATGNPAVDPWDVSVKTVVGGTASRQVRVVYQFDSGVFVESWSGAGWTCRTVADGVNPSTDPTGFYFDQHRTPLLCAVAYVGAQPPPVVMNVTAVDANMSPIPPEGTITLRSGGMIRDTARFGPGSMRLATRADARPERESLPEDVQDDEVDIAEEPPAPEDETEPAEPAEPVDPVQPGDDGSGETVTESPEPETEPADDPDGGDEGEVTEPPSEDADAPDPGAPPPESTPTPVARPADET